MSGPSAARGARNRLTVLGGGLAGSEAAWQAASRGVDVTLVEMRPERTTPAHRTGYLAELVCSNSLGSDLPDRAGGLLKAELRRLGSMVIAAADDSAVPAGGALAVDRERFGLAVTEAVAGHPRITIVRAEATRVPDGPCIVATGPLTTDPLADDLARLTGERHLHFYDALAPIVAADTIDMSVAFRASRYGRGVRDDGDYVNCPLDRDRYESLREALLAAERIELRDFESGDERFFEACLPVEVLAARGPEALLYGPLRPVGLRDPRTGRRPYGVVQLRQDDAAGRLYNMVGFQTNLRWPEQQRVLRLIPGLERAEFVRLGQMHRNTFVDSPALLDATLRLRPQAAGGRSAPLWIAGQLCGIEGYAGNVASGLVAGMAAAHVLGGRAAEAPPHDTMMGALCRYVTEADPATFQPMKANFGLLPPGPARGPKAERHRQVAERALGSLDAWMAGPGWSDPVDGPRFSGPADLLAAGGTS